jgi:2-phospho-L-lactate guanylyltransferase
MSDTDTWALVPLKRLDRAKQRLAPVLTSRFREELVLAMLTDVLEVLARIDSISRILLVSNDPEAGSVLHAGKHEVFYSAASEGMNRELEQAAAYASSQGAQRVLVVHSDLPYITAQAVRKFITVAPKHGLQAAACKLGTGTNLLLLPLPLSIPLVFGEDSLLRFQELTASAGLELEVISNPRLAEDVDDPEDYQRLSNPRRGSPRPGRATRAFLRRTMAKQEVFS